MWKIELTLVEKGRYTKCLWRNATSYEFIKSAGVPMFVVHKGTQTFMYRMETIDEILIDEESDD